MFTEQAVKFIFCPQEHACEVLCKDTKVNTGKTTNNQASKEQQSDKSNACLNRKKKFSKVIWRLF